MSSNADVLKQIMAAISTQSQNISTLSTQVKALDGKVNELNTALLAEQKAHTDDLTSVATAISQAVTAAALPKLSPLGQSLVSGTSAPTAPAGNRK